MKININQFMTEEVECYYSKVKNPDNKFEKQKFQIVLRIDKKESEKFIEKSNNIANKNNVNNNCYKDKGDYIEITIKSFKKPPVYNLKGKVINNNDDFEEIENGSKVKVVMTIGTYNKSYGKGTQLWLDFVLLVERHCINPFDIQVEETKSINNNF